MGRQEERAVLDSVPEEEKVRGEGNSFRFPGKLTKVRWDPLKGPDPLKSPAGYYYLWVNVVQGLWILLKRVSENSVQLPVNQGHRQLAKIMRPVCQCLLKPLHMIVTEINHVACSDLRSSYDHTTKTRAAQNNSFNNFVCFGGFHLQRMITKSSQPAMLLYWYCTVPWVSRLSSYREAGSCFQWERSNPYTLPVRHGSPLSAEHSAAFRC